MLSVDLVPRPDGAMSSWSPLGADTGSMCDTGAVLNEKLYCISLCNDPYVKVWNMNSTGGHDKPLRVSLSLSTFVCRRVPSAAALCLCGL